MDKLEAEMPPVLLCEWIYYLNWEIQEWTKAILSAIPAAKDIESNTSSVITDPEEKAAVLDMIGRL